MKKASIFLMALLCVFSCTKKKEDQDPSPTASPYFHPEVGNYWVYKNYKISPSGEEVLPGTDIITVSGDTIIHNKRYAVFSGTNLALSEDWRVWDILRDSSGHIVDQYGIVRFSSANNIGDTISTYYNIAGTPSQPDTFAVFHYFISAYPRFVHTPAGAFPIINCARKMREIRSTVDVNTSNCYASGIGLVMSQDGYEYLLAAGIYYERRLVNYHVKSKTP